MTWSPLWGLETSSGRTWTSSRGTGRAGTLRPGLRGWRVSSGREATRGFWLLEERNLLDIGKLNLEAELPRYCVPISVCRTNKTFYLGVLIFVTLGSQHTIIIYSFIVESCKSHLNDNSIFVLSTELIWHFSLYLSRLQSLHRTSISTTLPPWPYRVHTTVTVVGIEKHWFIQSTVPPDPSLYYLVSRLDINTPWLIVLNVILSYY